MWMLQRGHSGDGCVLASTLCKYCSFIRYCLWVIVCEGLL